MSRLFTSGFEAQHGIADGFTAAYGATLSVDTSVFRSGAASLKEVTSGGGSAVTATFTSTLGRTYYLRTYIYVQTRPPTTTQGFMQFRNTSFSTMVEARMTTTGAVQLWNRPGASQIGSLSAVLNLNTWYRIELACNINTGSVDTAELRIDGSTVASASSLALGDIALGDVNVGFVNDPGNGTTINFDDMAVNDDQGSSQNTFPGDGNVVLLVPTADSAVGTGWTNDAAGTTNLFAAVDNTPPAGIADTTGSTGLHQIRNATSNANSNYDATMTTYTAAGIGAGSTINVIDPLIATAAPVSTSAKLGTVGVVSNPAITNVNLGAGGTSGAFWSGVAAGTFSTGWKLSHGTITHAPTVTLGTAPVMRVTQVTASTRIAMVCFMAMYVDYTPGAAAAVIPDLVMAPLSHA